MYKTIDLFAGAGGITEGFRKAGYTCVCANDFDEEAKHTFTFNHPLIPYLLKDIREVTSAELLLKAGCNAYEIDVMTGGPPCQGFSLVGQRLSDDPRNVLFREYIRIAKDIQPKVIFFENVYGIMNMQNGRVLNAILEKFGEIGYQCKYALINAADYGVPQSRPRFVLIGVRGSDKKITFPETTHGKVIDDGQIELFEKEILPYVTVEEALSNLPQIDQGEGEEEIKVIPSWKNTFQKERVGERIPGIIFNHRATKHSKAIQERYAMIPQGRNNSVLPPEIRTKKQNAYKLDVKLPSRTVTCNFRTDLIHPIMNRGLTVREAARLQSFDDDYCFFGNLTRKAKWLTQDDQVGNAVPPLLAQAFATHIMNYILPQF